MWALVPCEEVPCHDSGTRGTTNLSLCYAKRLADLGSYARVVLFPPSEQGSLAAGPLLMIIFLVRSHQFADGARRVR